MTPSEVRLDLAPGEPRPVCPHCDAELDELRQTSGRTRVSALVELLVDTFSCPRCGKILSVSGRR